MNKMRKLVSAFLQYNDNTVEGRLFYQALNVVLEVQLNDELELDDHVVNFRRMYGDARMDAVMGSVDGSARFWLDANKYETGWARQPQPPDRQLQKTACGAGQCGGCKQLVSRDYGSYSVIRGQAAIMRNT